MAYYGIPPGWVYDELRGWHAPPDNTSVSTYPDWKYEPNQTGWPLRELSGDDVAGHHAKSWKFCPHCGERLEAAGAPFWNPEPLYSTNEARVREAEDEGGEL